jgi:hypothetical protein
MLNINFAGALTQRHKDSNIKRIIVLSSLLFINQANSGQFNNAAGIGLQYVGLIGYQLSYKES